MMHLCLLKSLLMRISRSKIPIVYGQHNPFMPRPNPLMPNAANGLPMEFMEQLQRLIQLRNLGNAEQKQGRD